jgi:hypothetical protein
MQWYSVRISSGLPTMHTAFPSLLSLSVPHRQCNLHILDINNSPVSYLKHDVSETRFCLHNMVEPAHIFCFQYRFISLTEILLHDLQLRINEENLWRKLKAYHNVLQTFLSGKLSWGRLIQFKLPTSRFKNIYHISIDRLCGLVVTVLGYRSGGPGSIPGTTKKKVVGLERGPHSLVSTTEELLERKVVAPV